MAPWTRSGPGDPKVAPNRPFGAICGSLDPIRARRPESSSKPCIWSHLSLPGPDPGQETRKWLHKVFWDSSVALGPEPNRDCQTLDCFTPDYYKPHTGHTMVGKCRPHDYRPRTHHTIAGHTQATRRPPLYNVLQGDSADVYPPAAQCPMTSVQHHRRMLHSC